MPDPAAQVAEAKRWLARAGDDLRLAEHIAATHDLAPWSACHHAQQAAEKALKAALVHDAISPPRTHDLDGLTQAPPERWSASSLGTGLADLSRWAVEGRYPGEDASREDANAATAMARQVFDAIAAELTHPAEDGEA
jgi:HEPN domain-containing protein